MWSAETHSNGCVFYFSSEDDAKMFGVIKDFNQCGEELDNDLIGDW